MKEKIVKVNEKEYTVTELKYKDIAEVSDLSKSEVAKALLVKATGISNEEYDELSMKDGITLMSAVNELNGLTNGDFQTAA